MTSNIRRLRWLTVASWAAAFIFLFGARAYSDIGMEDLFDGFEVSGGQSPDALFDSIYRADQAESEASEGYQEYSAKGFNTTFDVVNSFMERYNRLDTQIFSMSEALEGFRDSSDSSFVRTYVSSHYKAARYFGQAIALNQKLQWGYQNGLVSPQDFQVWSQFEKSFDDAYDDWMEVFIDFRVLAN